MDDRACVWTANLSAFRAGAVSNQGFVFPICSVIRPVTSPILMNKCINTKRASKQQIYRKQPGQLLSLFPHTNNLESEPMYSGE